MHYKQCSFILCLLPVYIFKSAFWQNIFKMFSKLRPKSNSIMLLFMLNQNLNSVNRKILSLLDMKEAGMEEKPILSASCYFLQWLLLFYSICGHLSRAYFTVHRISTFNFFMWTIIRKSTGGIAPKYVVRLCSSMFLIMMNYIDWSWNIPYRINLKSFKTYDI